jgi:hypothetical protein
MRYNGIDVHIRFYAHNQFNCFQRIIFDVDVGTIMHVSIGIMIYFYSHLFIKFRLSADNISHYLKFKTIIVFLFTIDHRR